MKRKKLLTVFLATLLICSSSASVFADETKTTSRHGDYESTRDFGARGDFDKNQSTDRYSNTLKAVSTAKVVVTPKATTPDKDCTASKDDNVVKDTVSSKDYNLGKDVNIGSAIRDAQQKAKEIVIEPVKEAPPKVEVSQELKAQIKAEYSAMRATEVANKATFVSAVHKKNQVVSYIHEVAQGKITYTDAQLTQIDALTITFITDIKAITDATASIKTAEVAVKESAKSKNYEAVLVALKIEGAARIARGTALTKVSEDLDAFLLVLAEGQAVLPTPETTPAPSPTTTPAPTAEVTPVTEPVVVPAT